MVSVALPSLLTRVGSLLEQRRAALPPDHRFNVFRLLRPAHDEVRVHSRFLFELLNPKGSHGLGNVFLRLFVTHCQLPAIDYDTVAVHRESTFIDLLIQDKQTAIIIENKIYASDQPQQIQRYDSRGHLKHLKRRLLYLTLDGRGAPEHSTGGLPCESLSYALHIDEWLTACIKEAVLFPTVRETIVQYQKLTRQLTGKTMSNPEELLVILRDNDNAVAALELVKNWNHVRHDAEFQFWTALQKEAEKASFIVLTSPNYPHFNSENIDRAIRQKKDRKTGYGLNFNIHTLLGVSLRFKITRGEELISYGIMRPSADVFPEAVRATVFAKLDTVFNSSSERSFLTSEANRHEINFQTFTPATANLINPEKRSGTVQNVWQDVAVFIANCQRQLEQVDAEIKQ